MSRSNPNEHIQNPSTRWFEWSGKNGQVKYYDKPTKKDVTVPDGFTFILLDQLSVIKGWHESSNSGITSNEVRDTKHDEMIVRAFKGGIIAKGLYSEIKAKAKEAGGKFVCNNYIAYKDGDALKIGSLQLKGAGLNSWVEFSKLNREVLYKKAVQINGSTDGKKGAVEFKIPKFDLKEITPETNDEATKLDESLQTYLKAYFANSVIPSKDGHQEDAPDSIQEDRTDHAKIDDESGDADDAF